MPSKSEFDDKIIKRIADFCINGQKSAKTPLYIVTAVRHVRLIGTVVGAWLHPLSFIRT